jgi:GMP synthase-like glutamine amidotransferase
VVAGTPCNDASFFGVAKLGEFVHGAANFECASALQVLGFQHDLAAEALAEIRGGNDGCVEHHTSAAFAGGGNICWRWVACSHVPTTVLLVRALLIANAGDADAGFVGQRFEEYDFSFTHVVREYPNEWPSIDGIDLVVHLGSNWSVYWDDVSRNVAAESELIREAHRRGIPLFGICFGAQIMAHALGGSAERAKKAEIGWHDVIATPTYKVLAGTWMQWHYDTFSAPAGAQVLALSDAGPQAMQMGRSFATQFHPEANEAIVSRWMGGEGAAELAAIDLMPSTLIERTRSEVERSGPAAQALVDWYLAEVASTPMPKAKRGRH